MFLAALLFATAASTDLPVFSLPNGGAGIGFDDLGYSSALGRIIVPAGRTGNIDLIDPNTRTTTMLSGFSTSDKYEGGHDFGVTSAVAGEGMIYATDRTAGELVTVDFGKRRIVSRLKLSAGPDYVRYVASRHEVWVTEPDASQIEVFSLADPGAPKAAETIAIEGGPESLVIDDEHGRAYTNLWKSTTLSIDLETRKVVARWPNQCEGSRGLALDREHDILFVGCAEGKAVALSDGKVVAEAESGQGVDIIDFAAGRLFVPGGKSGTLTIFATDENGAMKKLRTVKTAEGAKCVVADPKGRAFVCDPARGRLIMVDGR
ncbi:MAG: hypothetical protein ABI837_19495 [Acidobacteriota bacterium]